MVENRIKMSRPYIPMFDEREFVLVCRKSDYENNNIGDGVFLVFREEWEVPR